MPTLTTPRHRSRVEHQALIDRLIMLRTALEGVTNDNAALRRQLARLRVENRELQVKLGQPPEIARMQARDPAETQPAASRTWGPMRADPEPPPEHGSRG